MSSQRSRYLLGVTAKGVKTCEKVEMKLHFYEFHLD